MYGSFTAIPQSTVFCALVASKTRKIRVHWAPYLSGKLSDPHTAISNISYRLENIMENVSFKVIGKVERNHLFSNLEKASGKDHFPTSFHSHWKQSDSSYCEMRAESTPFLSFVT
jgi:hypothetical protein